MDYICISNKGLIVPEDLYLIGSSTKRGDESKIGMFGSGWKYALATLLRNGITIQLFTGTTKIDIGTKGINHRGMLVNAVTINDYVTSMTTEMGFKWEIWMALREIISNAIDESEYSLSIDSEVQPKEGYTTVYIAAVNGAQEVIRNFSKYFCFNLPPNFTLNYTNFGEEGSIDVFVKEEIDNNTTIYRKGIKCTDEVLMSNVNLNFNNLDIDENRLANMYHIQLGISYSIPHIDDAYKFKIMIQAASLLGCFTNLPDDLSENNYKALLELIRQGYDITSDFILVMFGALSNTDNTIIIPHSWYYTLVKNGNIEDKQNILLSIGYPKDFIENNDITFNKQKVLNIIKELNSNFEIITGRFKSQYDVIRIANDYKVFLNCDIQKNEEEIAGLIVTRCSYKNVGAWLSAKYENGKFLNIIANSN